MSILDEASRLNAAGKQEEAVALVERAGAEGDAEALFALGNWRLFGIFGARDIESAHSFFRLAADKGHIDAIRTKAILTANGTGVDADQAIARQLLGTIRDHDPHAALQLSFSGTMRPLSAFAPDHAKSLSEAPVIKYYPALLSAGECAYLTGMAQPHLRSSFVTNPSTGQQMPHPIRTSTGMSFGPTQEDLVVRTINERIAAVTDTDVGCGEPLHILHYTPGQQYKPHTDGMPGEVNQRLWTVLIYLNAEYEGGSTDFPKLGIRYRGNPGDALIFHNVGADGKPNPATLHAGLPVTQGFKWLATRWIRAQTYHPWNI